MATYETRSGKIRAIIYVDKKRLSKTFTTKAEAKLWAISMENGLEYQAKKVIDHRSVKSSKYRPKNFREVLSEYETKVTSLKESPDNEYTIIRFLNRVPWINMPWETVSVRHIAEYRDMRLRTVKGSTLHRQFDIIRHAATIAQDEWDWDVDAEMVKKVKIKIDPPSDHKRVSDAQIQQLLDAADGYLKVKYFIPMIKFTLETGLRRQELADLTWDAIKPQQRFIQVSKTKNGYPRRIPLTSKIKGILDTVSPNPSSHYNIPDSAPVFTHSVRSIECAFKRVKKRSGVNFTLHMLRHEAISRLFEQGLSPIEVASISGHRTLSQLMRYSHADTQNLLQKMEGNLS
jgi:integrase